MSVETQKMNQVPSTALVKLNQDVWKDYLAAQDARLPPLSPVQNISDRVIRILGGNAGWMRLQGTNTKRSPFLPQMHNLDFVLTVEQHAKKGESSWIEHVKEVLEGLGITLAYVLLIHWHRDHTGGIPDLLAYRPEFADRIHKCDPDPYQKPIKNGQVFHVEGATLRAILTPGHSDDHMCFNLEEENALFTGDNVLGHGQSVFEDLSLYTRSLSEMTAQACDIGYPAHGDVIRSLPQKLREVVKRREFYERQTYQALACSQNASSVQDGTARKSGGLSIPELVETMYGRVDPEAYKWAVLPTVSGILAKLAEDRKVGFRLVDGEKRWFVRDHQIRPRARRTTRD